jgi:hypothetical protein
VVSYGLCGALVEGLPPGTLVVAERVVDEAGETLWAGEPLRVDGARVVTVCGSRTIVDEPTERAALAGQTGAQVVDLETGPLARSGRLVGVLRGVADTPTRPLGLLADGVLVDGGVAWRDVLLAFARRPVSSARSAAGARAALAAVAAVTPEDKPFGQ